MTDLTVPQNPGGRRPPILEPQLQPPRPDIFNELAGQTPEPPPGPRYTTTDLALGVADHDNALARQLHHAVEIDPDLRAEANGLGIETGLEPEVVERNIDRIRQLSAERHARVRDLARQSPILARQLLDPKFAALAHDDIHNLSALEAIVAGWNRGWIENEVATLYDRQAAGDTSPLLQQQIDDLTARLYAMPQSGGFRFGRIFSTPGDALMSVLTGGAQMAGMLVPSLRDAAPEAAAGAIIGGLAGGPAGAALGFKVLGGAELARQFFIQERGASYQELRQLGIDHERAASVSMGVGAVNAALEFAGWGIISAPARSAFKQFVKGKLADGVRKLTVGAAAREFAKATVESATGEAVTEAVQEMANYIGEEVALYQQGDPNAWENAKRRQGVWDRMWQVGQEAFGSALALGGMSAGVRFTADMQRVRQAETTSKFVQDLAQGTQASKHAERAPGQFERFLAKLADGQPVENLYFEARAFDEALAQAGVDRESLRRIVPEVERQIDEAKESGGDVVIPAATYGAQIARTPLHEVLAQDARISPDLPSLRTVASEQASAAELAKEAEAILQKHLEADDRFIEEVRAVEKGVRDQVQATGRVRKQEARAAGRIFRDWVAVLAEKTGKTPGDIADLFPFKIVSNLPRQLGGESLQQSGPSARFFSAATNAIESLPTKVTTPDGWKQSLAGLLKKGTIKESELRWTGFREWLDLQSGKITKAQILEFLRDNGVRVEIVTRKQRDDEQIARLTDDLRKINEEIDAAIVSRQEAFARGREEFLKIEEQLNARDQQLRERRQRLNDQIAALQQDKPAKFGEYVLPGGTNYREILITLPLAESEVAAKEEAAKAAERAASESFDAAFLQLQKDMEAAGVDLTTRANAQWWGFHMVAPAPEAEPQRSNIAEQKAREAGLQPFLDQMRDVGRLQVALIDAGDAVAASRGFRGGHFEEPNVLAHLRVDDRVDTDGKRTLFVEEIQSDWAQKFRAESSIRDQIVEAEQRVAAARDAIAAHAERRALELGRPLTTEELRQDTEARALQHALLEALETSAEQENRSLVGIPRAPFIETTKGWLNLALKQLLLEAINGDYDSLAIIDGELSASRYDLSQHVDRLTWEPYEAYGEKDRGFLTAFRDGEEIDLPGARLSIGPQELADTIGKELAQRLIAAPEIQGTTLRELSGIELQVGGEGIIEFYDKIVPDALVKLSKKLSGPKRLEGATFSLEPGPTDTGQFDVPANLTTLSLAITDTLRETVQGGLSLFQGESQQPRGEFFARELTAALYGGADFSTVVHEMAHYFFEVTDRLLENPAAPQALVDDFNAFLKWTGVESYGDWQAMSFEQKRPHTEAFAYAFEVYLFEGRAPAAGLQKLFDRVRRFMVRVYRDVLSVLNPLYREEHGRDLPALTDELRGVFDRMLASEQAVEHADAVRGFAPLFETQKESGLSDERWAAYQKALSEARDAAVTDVTQASLAQMQWLSGARNRVLADLQKKHRRIRRKIAAETLAELEERPVYRAIGYLRRGEVALPDGVKEPAKGVHRLDTEAARALLPEGRTLQQDLAGMTMPGGLSPDVVAEMFGFENGAALVRSLAESPAIRDRSREMTDARMLERHSHLIDPEKIERTIQEALHNEARTRFVAVELRFLQNIQQPVRVMSAAAKIAAQRILRRKKVRDVRPADFEAAQMRARRAAEKALRSGDQRAAIEAKQHELLQFHLAKEALRARAAIDQFEAFTRKFHRNDKTLAAQRNIDYIGIGRAILYAHGLGPPSEPHQPHMENVQQYAPELLEDLRPLIEAALDDHTPYRSMTLEDAEVLEDAVRSLWEQSRRDHVIEVEGKREERRTVVATLLDAFRAPPETRRGRSLTPFERKSIHFGALRAWFRQVEAWAIAMDGGQPGPIHRYLFQLLRTPVDDYEHEKGQIVRELHDRINAHDFGDPRKPINARELLGPTGDEAKGFEFRNKAELIGALRHASSNLRKFLIGNKLVPPPEEPGGPIQTGRWWTFINRMIDEGVLTKADFDYVQYVWDIYDALWPRSQRAHFEVYGYRAEEVQKEPIATPWGTYRGGYAPLIYDPDERPKAGVDIEDDLSQNPSAEFRRSFPISTGRGHMISRVREYYAPLLLDPRLDAHQLDKHLRFIHLQRPGRDVLRLLRDHDLEGALRQIDPNIVKEMFMPWLESTLQNRVATPGGPRWFNKFATILRRRVGLAIMFGNVAVGVQQLTGIGNSLLYADRKYLRSAAALYLRTWFSGDLVKEIIRLSKFMHNRLSTGLGQIRDDIDVMLKPTWVGRTEEWSLRHGYFLQRFFQQPVDIITWKGRYDQSVAEGRTEAQAIIDADAAVRRSQGSGQVVDMARIEKGHPIARVFLQFGSFWITTANAVLHRPTIGQRVAAGAIAVAFAGIAAGAITQALRGGWEDDDDDGALWDDIGKWAWGEAWSTTAGVVAPVFGPLLLRPVTGEFGGRLSLGGATGSAVERSLQSIRALRNSVTDEKALKGATIRDLGMLISLITGIPVTPITDRARFLIDAKDEADRARGVLVGR